MVVVTKDVDAVLIPSGVSFKVVAGTKVKITQFKGGNATIYFNGNMARVANADLGAIGIIESEQAEKSGNNDLESPDDAIKLDLIWQALRTCYDPEIMVNIVDLGLIYGCRIIDHTVSVDMTLTTPMCGMGPTLINDVKNVILKIPKVTEVEVQLIFDPPWSTELMSESAKIELGLI